MAIPCFAVANYGVRPSWLILAYGWFLKQGFNEGCLISSLGNTLYLAQMRATPEVRALAERYGADGPSALTPTDGRSG